MRRWASGGERKDLPKERGWAKKGIDREKEEEYSNHCQNSYQLEGPWPKVNGKDWRNFENSKGIKWRVGGGGEREEGWLNYYPKECGWGVSFGWGHAKLKGKMVGKSVGRGCGEFRGDPRPQRQKHHK